MHGTVKNLIHIQSEIKQNINKLNLIDYNPTIIAVSKTFKMDHISHIVNFGHTHFGENKVQEAQEKWSTIKEKNQSIKLHMIGKLQSNKVKNALKIFDFIHSVDSKKLAQKISIEQKNLNKKIEIFLQVNLANETQKSGLNRDNVKDFYKQCQDLDLNIIGTMCLPPMNLNPQIFFLEMKKINLDLNLKELSMGMSSDYIEAVKHHSTYLRIGSNIFGKRN